jgi:hypothetical protein
MGIVRLTSKARGEIAVAAAEELFVFSLRMGWERVRTEISALVKEAFKDFDWEHVEPYWEYINWSGNIRMLHLHDDWDETHWDDFRKDCRLPYVGCVELTFKYPFTAEQAFLDDEFKKRAVDILRPYMAAYYEARGHYEDLRGALSSINTYKQLAAAMPELMKYAQASKRLQEAETELRIGCVKSLLQKEAV